MYRVFRAYFTKKKKKVFKRQTTKITFFKFEKTWKKKILPIFSLLKFFAFLLKNNGNFVSRKVSCSFSALIIIIVNKLKRN